MNPDDGVAVRVPRLEHTAVPILTTTERARQLNRINVQDPPRSIPT